MHSDNAEKNASTTRFFKKRRLLTSATIAGLMTLAGCDAPTSTTESTTALPKATTQVEKPLNVLMIAVDDLNNWVGPLRGEANTPNLDRLASQGVHFSNAHAVVPACNPSRVAIFSGRRPESTGQYRNPGDFRDLEGNDKLVTMPQLFSQNGYESVAAGKLFHKQRGKDETPMEGSDDISWDYQAKVDIGTGGESEYRDENGNAKWMNGDLHYDDQSVNSYLAKFGIWGPTDIKTEETGDYDVATFCSDYMQKDHDKPFFLACGLFRPHSAQIAPRQYFDMYPLEEMKTPPHPEEDIQDLPDIAKYNFASTFAKKVINTDDQWLRAVQAYKASTTFADDMIGIILDGLEKSPYKDNTIVVLWGDHGWQIGQKYRWEKFSLWSQGTQTPFIIKVPGMPAQVVEKPVTLLDIYPTLVELTKVGNKTVELDGSNLLPLMKDPKTAWDKPAIVTYEPNNHSVHYDHWNFIQYSDGSIELYDGAKDPDEWHNIASDPNNAAIISKLKEFIPKYSRPCVPGQCQS